MIGRLKIFFVLILIPGSGYAQHWESVGVFNMYPTVAYVDSASNLLYTAGYFTSINAQQRWGVASWNNSSWDSLGLGIDYDTVSSQPQMTRGFLKDNGYLYAVGSFMRAGVINTNGIARWDGVAWDSVPGCRIPDYQTVSDIIKYNGEIYICGSFDSVGNIPAFGLAKWNGTSWQAVANNYGFTVPSLGVLQKMLFYHGRLYVAGYFQDANGNTCRLARWDGWNWHFMTTDIQGSLAAVLDMEVYQDKLYVAGIFFQSAGNVANGLQSWNDTTWCAVGGSMQILNNQNPTIRDLCVYDNKLYCAGNFEMIGGIPANSIAIWDGNDWCSLGSSFDMGGLAQVTFYQDTMYVIGGFWNIDSLPIAYVAKWIGGSYSDTCGHLTIGVEEHTSGYPVSVFPTPANHRVTFSLGTAEQRDLVVTDNLGRVIYRKQTSDATIEFPAHEFPDGMYFYTVLSENNAVAQGKFVIQH